MTRMEWTTSSAPVAPLRILLMGPYGIGKTYLIGYFNKRLQELTGKGIKDFDFDLGWPTLKNAGFNVDGISYVIDPDNMGSAFDEFDIDFHQYLNDPHGYGGFAIDSLTTLQACTMDYVFRENVRVGGESINRRRVGRTQLATENDYGALVVIMGQLLPQILQISRHSIFIMTAHTRMMEDKASGEMKIMPAISGRSLPSQIGGWFNEVWYLRAEGYRGDVTRLAQTASGGQVDCKTQIAGMPYDLPVLTAAEKALVAYGINQEPTEETQKLLAESFPEAS